MTGINMFVLSALLAMGHKMVKSNQAKSNTDRKYFFRKMLKSVLSTFVKRTNLKMLYWKIVKNNGFNFLKVKKLLNF